MDNYKVLRASRIGSLCDRSLFYSVSGAEEIKSAEFLNPSSFSGYAMTDGMSDATYLSTRTRV